MYKTRKSTQLEENRMRKSIPSPFGHTVTGFSAEFHPVIETDSEATARDTQGVEYIRYKQPDGNYRYRTILETDRPTKLA